MTLGDRKERAQTAPVFGAVSSRVDFPALERRILDFWQQLLNSFRLPSDRWATKKWSDSFNLRLWKESLGNLPLGGHLVKQLMRRNG